MHNNLARSVEAYIFTDFQNLLEYWSGVANYFLLLLTKQMLSIFESRSKRSPYAKNEKKT